MGLHHAVKYRSLEEVDLVAIVDRRMLRATEVAAQLGCKAFESVDDLLASDLHIDAATVATPTNSHYPIATRLLQEGIHCIVEKPLALTSTDARALVETARGASRILLPGHIERFNPAVRSVRDRKGDFHYITAYRVGPMSFRSVDTDVVLDVMTHDIDIALFLTGCADAKVEVVRAFSSPENINDIAKAEIRFGSCLADLVASRLAIARRRKMRLYASDGYYSIDCSQRSAVHLDRDRYVTGLRELHLYQEMGREIAPDAIFAAVGAEHIADPQRYGTDPLTEEIKYFLGLVNGTIDDDILKAEDGVTVVAIAEAILRLCSPLNTFQAGVSFRAAHDSLSATIEPEQPTVQKP